MVFFEKSQQAPSSLALKKSYREQDVMERLRSDFKNKCYLCEAKAPTSINVEHFHSHRGNKELEYDWKNLFYSCAHCNNTKEMLERDDAFREVGILDCTSREDCVDEWISYRIEAFPKTTVLLEREKSVGEKNVCRVDNTIRLLDAIYNGSDTAIKGIEAENLRMQLLNEIGAFQDLILSYFKADASQRTWMRGCPVVTHP